MKSVGYVDTDMAASDEVLVRDVLDLAVKPLDELDGLRAELLAADPDRSECALDPGMVPSPTAQVCPLWVPHQVS